MNRLLVVIATCLAPLLNAEIIETINIDDVRAYVTTDSLCLFDVDDTLIANPFHLGAGPWRKWAKPYIEKHSRDFSLYDALTFLIAVKAPYQPVEDSTATLISDLQDAGITSIAFTARAVDSWHATVVDGLDQFTHAQLKHAGIDFSRTVLPQSFEALERCHFREGILFSAHVEKGTFLKHVIQSLNYKPGRIIFVDDRLDQVQSVAAAAAAENIPFTGFWYRRSNYEHANFNPLATLFQLDRLLDGQIVSDEEAELFMTVWGHVDCEMYFHQLLDKIQTVPVIDTALLNI